MDRHRPARPRATVRPPRHLLTAAQARSPPHPIAPLFFTLRFSLRPKTVRITQIPPALPGVSHRREPRRAPYPVETEATCTGLGYSLPDHCHPTPPNCKTLRSAPPHGVNPVDHTITDGTQTRTRRAYIPNSGGPRYAEPPCSSPAIPRWSACPRTSRLPTARRKSSVKAPTSPSGQSPRPSVRRSACCHHAQTTCSPNSVMTRPHRNATGGDHALRPRHQYLHQNHQGPPRGVSATH